MIVPHCLHLYFYKIFENSLLWPTMWVYNQKVWQWMDFMILLVIIKYFPIAHLSKLKFPSLVFKVLDQFSVSSSVLTVLFQCVPKSPEKDHLGHLVNTHVKAWSPTGDPDAVLWGGSPQCPDITFCICFFMNPLGLLSFKDFYSRNSQIKFKAHLVEYFHQEICID